MPRQSRSGGSNPPMTYSPPSRDSALTILQPHDMADLWFGTLDHFQPDCAGRKCSNTLFDVRRETGKE